MTIILKILLLLLVLSIFFRDSYSCSSSRTEEESSCFNSTTLSYPFSTTPGCGNPWFQIHCSNQSVPVISINGFSFSLLHFEPNTSSLLVSPLSLLNPTEKTHCSSVLTRRSINLSGSPFRFSDSTCSRLSFVKPCSKPALTNLPNCSVCSWECELYKQPIKLLHGCESKNHSDNQEEDEEHNGCQEDFLGFLEIYLKNGIQIQYDENLDTWFSNCRTCESKNGVCGFNSSDPLKPFLCFSSSSSQNTNEAIIHKHKSKKIALLIPLFIFGCVLFLTALILALFRFRKTYPSFQTEEDPTTLFLHKHRSPNLLLPPVYSYEELESATNGFDPKRKIGDGGFGSVFLGQLFDTRLVAVKKLHKLHSTTAASKPFCNEILILSSINHPNLVKLHGYCIDPRGLLLVYDYVPNGTLADHLHGSNGLHRKGSLSWQVRVEVALQTAMAVEYLHFSVDPAIVHRDITSSNIFVEKDMKIKVGDFGLSRLLIYPESSVSSRYIWTGPQGTPGYLDPDYHRSFRLTEKSDVYSLGVILLELISGMKAVDLNRDKREIALVDLVVSKIQVGCLHQVIDPVLVSIEGEGAEGIISSVESMAELAFRCVAAEKDDRPDAKEVVAQLKQIKNCCISTGRHR
ncbi:LEAF RUST 10 DISEASE-RESISTANCE LOCUS RECEPTOR-LIKE PROTEIN KINASE-like 1.5 [Papaver somniferum]|uniref:LEAF RUST 10 DISEASE-RESISTANCE LOCUS RECEPTOR-LIKE PROTEIN KINASE-like 1.5 n=1 Tax=Papaver somniferum TaxID=3469 RepID=UPI000E704B36|nr:LEAF RUST 10 DISEASE-RESISTANCE LOCUS RECEPTOR-LIKE PROTEIN KINASE-like 1.5 [Papaver somniferum]